MTDVSGDELQGFRPVHLGDHTLSVVEDLQTRRTALPQPGDVDLMGAGIQAVLDQLGEGLSRVGLAQREPSDQLEGILRAKPPPQRVFCSAGTAPDAASPLGGGSSWELLIGHGGKVAQEGRHGPVKVSGIVTPAPP